MSVMRSPVLCFLISVSMSLVSWSVTWVSSRRTNIVLLALMSGGSTGARFIFLSSSIACCVSNFSGPLLGQSQRYNRWGVGTVC